MNDPLFSLDDKVVLVTGGSRGLGRALSLGFAERGATVVVASRKLEACQAVVREIETAGGAGSALAVHVGDWSSLGAVVEGVLERWGRLDGLVNNAGMSPTAPSLAEVSEELFDKIIAVNLKGPTRLTALAASAMAATGGGAIVNISSLASLRPTPVAPVYGAAKAGLNAMTVAAAQEFAGLAVRVNAIVCGTFDTDATAGFVRDVTLLPEVVRPIALSRVGRPDELVGAAVYLLSDAASYTTGSLLTVDGGVDSPGPTPAVPVTPTLGS